jgi:AAA+ ATPase superfamily predicted ATPase
VPAYLERFDDRQTLSANLRRHLFRGAGMLRSEPMVLISDLVRETRTYESVLRAIATGNHTPGEIAGNTGLNSANLPPYLTRLRYLGLIERRVPATIPPDQRRTPTRSRYHLSDPYLRFYFRFIEPNLSLIEQELTTVLWDRISEQFRAFIGATAFEDLCRGGCWPRRVLGSCPWSLSWSAVIGRRRLRLMWWQIIWRDRAILLGECNWGVDTVDRAIVSELIDKAPKVVPGADWQVHYAYFGRAGFTEAARAEAEAHDALLIDLELLDTELRKALQSA